MSPSSRPRRWTFTHSALLSLLVFGTFEILSYAFGEYSRRNGNPYFIYRSDFFARLDPAEVAKRRYRPVGWPREQREPRIDPAKFDRICASAFGDSFTYGDEVENDQTWPHALADALKCEVRNFGFGAYGLDQAILRYELVKPETPVVLVGITLEMLRREVAASWVFYARRDISANFPPYFYEKPYFILRGNELIEIPLPPDPVTNSHMERHHQPDYYRRDLWTRLDFPYSLSVARALYRHFMRDPMFFRGPLFWQQRHPSGAAELALRLLDRLAKQVNERGRLAVVLTPFPSHVAENRAYYEGFGAALREQSPQICIISTFPKLRELASSADKPSLRMPGGHYVPQGNRAIADAVVAGLETCGITP